MRFLCAAIALSLATPVAAQKRHRLRNKLPPLSGLELMLSVSQGGQSTHVGCQSCWTPIEAYSMEVRIPAGYRFVRVDDTGVTVRIIAISPDRRRVRGEVLVGSALSSKAATGYHEVGVVVASETNPGDQRIAVQEVYVEGASGSQCRPAPCSTPAGFPQGSCQAVDTRRRCLFRLARNTGALRFGTHGASYSSGWPQTLTVAVGLPRRLAGRYALAEAASVTCTTGTARLISEAGGDSRLALTHRLTIDTRPTGADKRIAGGRHQCRVELKLVDRRRRSDRVITRAGTFRFRIKPDGFIAPVAGRCVTWSKRTARAGAKTVVCPR